jgi:DtxR family Mn-dependent transcriptional regulator
MTAILTQSIQDYLKQIYRLSRAGGFASTQELADALGVAPASVTGMMRRLASAEPPLAVYHKYQGVRLTGAGERAALEVIRRHRLLETYLVKALGYRWDEVHDEACRLEHVISEDFETRIAALLGNPGRDPHGDLIPGADLNMPADAACPLSGLQAGEKATVARVGNEDRRMLRYLAEIGLQPGTPVNVKGRSEFDHNLLVEIEGQEEALVLGPAVTGQIFVEKATRA